MGTIYKITNKVNSKIYIGCTVLTIEERLKSHFWKRNDGYALGSALIKYGLENFIIEKIDEANNKEDLLFKEKYWVTQYNSRDRNIGYNIAPGGGAIGRHATEEEREANRVRNLGRKTSEETKLKISLAQKGKPRSKEAAEKGNLKKRGRKRKPEHIEKSRLGNIGRIHSDLTKCKIRASNLGLKRSAETVKNISEATKKYNAANKNKLGEHIICLNNGKVYYSHQDAASRLSLNRASITSTVNSKRPHTRGFVFQKLTEEHLIF